MKYTKLNNLVKTFISIFSKFLTLPEIALVQFNLKKSSFRLYSLYRLEHRISQGRCSQQLISFFKFARYINPFISDDFASEKSSFQEKLQILQNMNLNIKFH